MKAFHVQKEEVKTLNAKDVKMQFYIKLEVHSDIFSRLQVSIAWITKIINSKFYLNEMEIGYKRTTSSSSSVTSIRQDI